MLALIKLCPRLGLLGTDAVGFIVYDAQAVLLFNEAVDNTLEKDFFAENFPAEAFGGIAEEGEAKFPVNLSLFEQRAGGALEKSQQSRTVDCFGFVLLEQTHALKAENFFLKVLKAGAFLKIHILQKAVGCGDRRNRYCFDWLL